MVLELTIPDTKIELSFPGGLSQEGFEQLCFANKELIVEREADGKIKIMSPVSYKSGEYEADFIADFARLLSEISWCRLRFSGAIRQVFQRRA